MSHKLRNSRHTQGFTLIELLVVIAIIAILAAILFPVFARARENARRASCQSNMKQMGLGLMQYTQDYDERFPSGIDNAPGELQTGIGWAGQIYPYVKSTQVYQCPNDRASGTAAGLAAGDTFTSYAYNLAISRIDSQAGVGPWGAGGALSAFNSAPKTVLLFEIAYIPTRVANPVDASASYGNLSASSEGYRLVTFRTNLGDGGCFMTGFMGNRGNVYPNYCNLPNGRHLEGSNFLCADGHVKWYRGDRVSTYNKAINPTAAQDANPGRAAGTENNAFAITFSPT